MNQVYNDFVHSGISNYDHNCFFFIALCVSNRHFGIHRLYQNYEIRYSILHKCVYGNAVQTGLKITQGHQGHGLQCL